jgi:hypothetical protein
MMDHSDHGRGGPDGPDDPDCPCRSTGERDVCAASGCGFCRAARMNEGRVLRDFVNRGEEAYRVLWKGMLCTPSWNSFGAADAYLTALRNGTRQPEFPT